MNHCIYIDNGFCIKKWIKKVIENKNGCVINGFKKIKPAWDCQWVIRN